MANSINLLPAPIVKRFRRRVAVQIWTKVLMATSVATVLAIVLGQSQATLQRQENMRLDASISRPKTVAGINDDLRVQAQRLKLIAHRQSEIRSVYSPLNVLAVLSQIKAEMDDQLQVESLEFSTADNKPNAGAAAEHGHVMLTVKTDSAANSARLVQLLRGKDMFRDVTLQSALEKTGNRVSDLRFVVKCTF